MSNSRQSPEYYLKNAASDQMVGGLRLFFGYAAGVGKTFAMLENAQLEKTAGKSVVIGWLEPHDRRETQSMAEGLEHLPPKHLQYKSVGLDEFDLDAALKLPRETILLIDELAHTNAEGSRNQKRWQDVEELLAAGYAVWSTMNVQHLESLIDVVERHTGVVVRETVPDRLLDTARAVELIDLEPAELFIRLREGKIYKKKQAEQARQSFFQARQLTALRELAMRRTATRLRTTLQDISGSNQSVLAEGSPLAVCIGPSPGTAVVLRAAFRMAQALQVPLHALYFHDGTTSQPKRKSLEANMRLARDFGASIHVLEGDDFATEIVAWSQASGVGRILLGTQGRRVRGSLRRTQVQSLLNKAGNIEVYLVPSMHGETLKTFQTNTGKKSARRWTLAANKREQADPPRGIVFYVRKVLYFLAPLLFGLVLSLIVDYFGLGEAATVLFLLSGVVAACTLSGTLGSVLAPLIGVLQYNYFFINPRYSFTFDDTHYLLVFPIFFAFGFCTGRLMNHLRRVGAKATARARRTEAQNRLVADLLEMNDRDNLIKTFLRHVAAQIPGYWVFFQSLKSGKDEMQIQGDLAPLTLDNRLMELETARWSMEHRMEAGSGTRTLPGATGRYRPVFRGEVIWGALGYWSIQGIQSSWAEHDHLVSGMVDVLCIALAADNARAEARSARNIAEKEAFQATMLRSLSHDIRTPLAAIRGFAETAASEDLSDFERRKYLDQMIEETEQLSSLVENILVLSRVQSNLASDQLRWEVLDDVVAIRKEY